MSRLCLVGLFGLLGSLGLGGCFYVGGKTRATIDLDSKRPTYVAEGHFGGFAQAGMDQERLTSTSERSGGYFLLAMGVARDERLERWQASVGPRFGWLWPHGFTEFAFDTRFPGSNDRDALFGVSLTAGPRFEISRSQSDAARSALVLAPGVVLGLSAGDGVRVVVGVSLDFHRLWWNPSARYD